jgi:hypothetical protein
MRDTISLGKVFITNIQTLPNISRVYLNCCVLNILSYGEDDNDVQNGYPEEDTDSILKYLTNTLVV